MSAERKLSFFFINLIDISFQQIFSSDILMTWNCCCEKFVIYSNVISLLCILAYTDMLCTAYNCNAPLQKNGYNTITGMLFISISVLLTKIL